MWIAGFDPGGLNSFGWCLAEAARDHCLVIRGAGVTDHASLAVKSVLDALPTGATLVAAGIDSPLYWSVGGDRSSDLAVRARIRQLGAPVPGGTVQSPNSLRGACLVQGPLATRALRRAVPDVRITESHPKALLWLLSLATRGRAEASICLADLHEHIVHEVASGSDHERDAALGALAALAMAEGWDDWRDLVADENDPFFPVGPVEYWMPLEAVEAHQDWRSSGIQGRRTPRHFTTSLFDPAVACALPALSVA